MTSDSKNILVVVDDEPQMRSLLKDFFSTQGFTVRGFSSPEKALEGLSTMPLQSVAAILSDVRMTPLNGKDFLKLATERYPGIPVVLFTAAGQPDEAKEAMRLGALLYLCQPFSLTEFKTKLEQALLARGKSHVTG